MSDEETEKPSILKRRVRRLHWVWMSCMLVLTSVAALFYWARFESYSFCYECALRKETVVWELPFSHRKLFETSEIYVSDLSEAIVSYELVDDHEHDWKFAFGSGHGSPLVFGTSRSVVSAMTSTNAGDFLGLVMIHQGRVEARKWLSGFRDNERAEWCRCIIESVSGQSFSGPSEFETKLAEVVAANEDFWH
jgi:hypothetical protein